MQGNTRLQRRPQELPSGFRSILSLHPFLEDLNNPIKCTSEVMLAYGSLVYATTQGELDIRFKSESGVTCKLKLLRVLHISGLNRRLFSIPVFVRNAPHQVTFHSNCTRFHFGDGNTLAIPVQRINNMGSNKTDQSQEIFEATKSYTLPTMSVEKGHKILAHRSIVHYTKQFQESKYNGFHINV